MNKTELNPHFSYNIDVESAYIITLKGHDLSEQLSQRCQQSCHEVGMPFQVWDAVDGTSGKLVLPEALREASYMHWPRWMDHELSITEVACALSHFSLWVRCIEIDRPIVILEHDAVMLQKYDRHPAFNSIVYLGGREQAKQGWAVLPTPPHATHGPNFHFICRAHAYAIDPSVAKNLVAHLIRNGIHESLDMMIRADLFSIQQVGLFAFDAPHEVTTIVDRKKTKDGLER